MPSGSRHRHVRLRDADAQCAQRLAVHPPRRHQDQERAAQGRYPAAGRLLRLLYLPQFQRAYLHHLHRVGEILGARLNTIHNLHYYQTLMAEMRAAIEQGDFAGFSRRFHRARAGERV
jgi:hypothetical protein